MQSVLYEPVLVLNRNWTPVDTCTVKKAFSRAFDDKAKFLNTEDDEFSLHDAMSWLDLPVRPGMLAITTSRFEIRVPEIIVLSLSEHIQHRRVMQFSRRHLARRDRMSCQYCGRGNSDSALTIDHVVPKSKGGKSTWENCVLSCFDCNSLKKNKSMDEVKFPDGSRMRLRPRPEMKAMYPNNPGRWTQPYSPSWSPIFRISHNKIKESWRKFLDEKVIESI